MKQDTADATRPALSRPQIVEVALSLVDAEGLERLTLRRLAEHLDVTPMALYWHFSDKEALLSALGEHLFDSIEFPGPGSDPLDELDAVLRSVVRSLSHHVAIAPLALSSVLTSDPGLVLAERVLGLLCDAGLDDHTAANIGGVLLHSTVALVTSIPRVVAKQGVGVVTSPHLDHYEVTSRLAAHLLVCDDVEGWLNDGLLLMMEGVRGLVARSVTLR